MYFCFELLYFQYFPQYNFSKKCERPVGGADGSGMETSFPVSLKEKTASLIWWGRRGFSNVPSVWSMHNWNKVADSDGNGIPLNWRDLWQSVVFSDLIVLSLRIIFNFGYCGFSFVILILLVNLFWLCFYYVSAAGLIRDYLMLSTNISYKQQSSVALETITTSVFVSTFHFLRSSGESKTAWLFYFLSSPTDHRL